MTREEEFARYVRSQLEAIRDRVAEGDRHLSRESLVAIIDGLTESATDIIAAGQPAKRRDWSGTPWPPDPANYWVDDKTGELVNAKSGKRAPAPVRGLLEAAKLVLPYIPRDQMTYSMGDHGERVYHAEVLRKAVDTFESELT